MCCVSGMITTDAQHTLIALRHELYQRVLDLRRDALFELVEATLVTAGPAPLIRLSLAPVFHRRWASAPDALADGTLHADRLRTLLQTQLAALPPHGRPLWALDGAT